MKTYYQWFNEKLPKKLAKKAIAYTKENFKDSPLGLNEKHDNFKSALMRAFIWQKTDERHGFWSQIYANNGMSKPKPKRKVKRMKWTDAFNVASSKWDSKESGGNLYFFKAAWQARGRYERRRLKAQNEN